MNQYNANLLKGSDTVDEKSKLEAKLEARQQQIIKDIAEVKAIIVYLTGNRILISTLVNLIEVLADNLADVNQKLDNLQSKEID